MNHAITKLTIILLTSIIPLFGSIDPIKIDTCSKRDLKTFKNVLLEFSIIETEKDICITSSNHQELMFDDSRSVLHLYAICNLLNSKILDLYPALTLKRDIYGNSILHYAVQAGAHTSTQNILSYKAILIHKTNNRQETPLHTALQLPPDCLTKKIIIKALLEANADPNAYNAWQETPLHLAVKNNDPESIIFLLEHKADPCRTNLYKQTPRTLAEALGLLDLLAILP